MQSTTNVQSNQKVPSSKHPNQSGSSADRTNDTDSASIGDQNSIDSNSLDDNSVTFRGGNMSSGGGVHDSVNSTNAQQIHATNNDDEEPITAQPIIPIHSKTKNWYSIYCNRWVSLFGALLKIVIMMFVNFYYGITCICLVFLTWFYVYV